MTTRRHFLELLAASAADWAVILKFGFPGMKARVDASPDTPFYAAENRTAAAMPE